MDKVLSSQARGPSRGRMTEIFDRTSGPLVPGRMKNQPKTSGSKGLASLQLTLDQLDSHPGPDQVGSGLEAQNLLGSEVGDMATPWDNTEYSLAQLKTALVPDVLESKAVKRKMSSEVVSSKKTKSKTPSSGESKSCFRSPPQTRDISE